MRRIGLILMVLLSLNASAHADVEFRIAREGVGWGLIAAGLVAGVLSAALLVENPSAPDYQYQRAAGWSAVGLSGAALLCGVIALNVPPRPFRRLAATPTGLVVHF
jgi:hypothetical protein